MSAAWKQWADRLKQDTYALYLASKHPGVPFPAKIMIALAVAYTLSPIDLIPDFIPVIGYLDDLLLLPLAIWLAIRLIPRAVWAECQASAAEQLTELPRNRKAAVVIVIIWILAIAACTYWVWHYV